MKVLIGCEKSGIVREEFRKRGHDAYSCDIEPAEDNGPHIQDDLLNVIKRQWDLMIAHPPCTFIAQCSSQWLYHPEDSHLTPWMRRPNPHYPERHKMLEEAVEFFLTIAAADIDNMCIENPIGFISKRFRPPDQIIQPYEFGHPCSKKTGLWLFGKLTKLKPTNIVEPEYITLSSGKRMPKWYADAKVSNDNERRRLRSATFPNVAKAMANQWG